MKHALLYHCLIEHAARQQVKNHGWEQQVNNNTESDARFNLILTRTAGKRLFSFLVPERFNEIVLTSCLKHRRGKTGCYVKIRNNNLIMNLPASMERNKYAAHVPCTRLIALQSWSSRGRWGPGHCFKQ